jgi:hypothetical protein
MKMKEFLLKLKMFIETAMLILRSSKYKRLTAYQLSKDKVVYIHRDTKMKTEVSYDRYPHMRCPYKDGDCNSDCAFFNTSWKTGSIILCGDKKIGVLV